MAAELYRDAAYYRMLFAERRHDVEHYRRVCEGAASVLELGVGQGRVAFALAEDGARVVGVDRSASMLAALDSRRTEHPPEVAGRVRVIEGDARTVSVEARFDAVIAPFNTVAHMHEDADLEALLGNARRHARSGGRVALDVLVPDPTLLGGGSSSVPRFVHPESGAVCRLEERYTYDGDRRILSIQTRVIERLSERVTELELALRQFGDDEIRTRLEAVGLEPIERCDLGDSVGWLARRP